MTFAIDFDGTIVEWMPFHKRDPLKLNRYAKEGLTALKEAGHTLILYSCRANRWGLYATDNNDHDLSVFKYRQMVEFVERELPSLFDRIDDGAQGKVIADRYIDDHAVTFGPRGMNWFDVAERWGEE